MNKFFTVLILFLAINVHATIEKKAKNNIYMLHNSAKTIGYMFDDLSDRADFLELYVEDLKDLKRMCELVIEDENYDLFEYTLLTADEKIVRIEENMQLMVSFFFDYIEEHEGCEDELEKIIDMFRKKGHELEKTGSKLVLFLHKNRSVAPYLLQKLNKFIVEVSHEINELEAVWSGE